MVQNILKQFRQNNQMVNDPGLRLYQKESQLLPASYLSFPAPASSQFHSHHLASSPIRQRPKPDAFAQSRDQLLFAARQVPEYLASLGLNMR